MLIENDEDATVSLSQLAEGLCSLLIRETRANKKTSRDDSLEVFLLLLTIVLIV